MLDLQAVHGSKGIRDVQYFLIHSLEPELLAECRGNPSASLRGMARRPRPTRRVVRL
ncbi:hypothetical protein K2X89_06765 [Myxococcota bacterium]|nr:hypothetical protein [Myxococcota bacterium]